MTTSTDTQIGGYVFHEGDRIRKAREALGIKQEELADMAELSRQSISNYERGVTVSRKARRLLAMSLGVTIEWLETGELNIGNGRPLGIPSDVNSGYRTRRRYLPAIIPSFAQIYAEAA